MDEYTVEIKIGRQIYTVELLASSRHLAERRAQMTLWSRHRARDLSAIKILRSKLTSDHDFSEPTQN